MTVKTHLRRDGGSDNLAACGVRTTARFHCVSAARVRLNPHVVTCAKCRAIIAKVAAAKS